MSFAAVATFVAPLVVPAIVGAGVGAVVAETTGGKWEKGAMYGAGGGAVLGGISALGGVPAAGSGVTTATQMAAIAEPGYYGVSAAAGLPAITKAVGAGAGIYGQLAQIEATKELTEAQKITAQTKLMEAEAAKIYAEAPPAIPTLASQTTQPIFVTPAAVAEPNYLLYIGLAIAALIFFKR